MSVPKIEDTAVQTQNGEKPPVPKGTGSRFHFRNSSRDDLGARKFRALFRLSIVDFYIVFNFIWILFVILFLLSALYVLLDFMNSADKFIQLCRENNLSVWYCMAKYYFPRLLVFYDGLLCALVIFSGIITMSVLNSRLELVGLASMGISRVRTALLIFLLTLVIVAISAYCREVIVPANRAILGYTIESFFSQKGEPVEPKSDPLTSVYINGQQLDRKKRLIIKPTFSMPVRMLDQYGSDLYAESAVWMPHSLGDDLTPARPAGFLLKNVVADKCLDDQKSLFLSDEQILYTPLNNSWLKKGECFLVSGIDVGDLTISRAMQEYTTISELQRIMERMPTGMRTDAAIQIHKRLARPILDFVVFFVGFSFMLFGNARGFQVIVQAIIWCLFAWLVVNVLQALGSDGLLIPAVAAWLPLIIISAIAAYFWDSIFT